MRRLCAWARRLVAVVVLVAIFGASVLVAALLHLNLRAVRRIVEGKVNVALSSLPGEGARISGLSRLTTTDARIEAIDVEVEGVGRIHAANVRIGVGLVKTAWDALRQRGVPALRVRDLSVSMLSLEVRTAAKRASAEGAGPAPRELRLEVGHIDVAHAYVHGWLQQGLYLDFDCDRSSGTFGLDARRAYGALATSVTARGLLPAAVSIDVDGSASVPLGPGANDAPRVDQRAVRVHFVARSADAELEAAGTLQGDRLEAEVSVPETSPEVVRALVPRSPLAAPVSLHARASGSLTAPILEADIDVGSGHLGLHGRAHLDGRPRAEVNIAAREIDPSAFVRALPASRIGFDADLDIDPDQLRATATMHEKGAALVAHATVAHGALDARAELDAGHGSLHGIIVDEAHAEIEVGGPLADLRGRLHASITGLRRGALGLKDLLVIAEGTMDSVDVEVAGKGGSLDVLALEATVEPTPALRISRLSARLQRAQRSIDLDVPEVVIAGPSIDIPHLWIGGAGQPIEGAIHVSPDRLQAKVSGPDVDLVPLSAFVSSVSGWLTGHGSMDVGLDVGPRGTKIDARVRLAHAQLGSWPLMDATLDLNVDGAMADGRLAVENADLGAATLEVQLDAGKVITGWRSLYASEGSVILSTERVPVGRLCLTIPCPAALSRSTASIHGTMAGRLELVRARGSGNDTKATLAVDVEDASGRLAFVNIESHVDLARALSLGRLPDDAPLQAQFGIESRPFEQLPPIFQPLPLSGRLAMHGYAEGTIAKPFFVVDVSGSELRAAGASHETTPIELGWVTTYDLEDAASDIDLRMGETHIARASLQIEASLQQLLGAPGDEPWTGGLYAELDRLPLRLVPSLAEHDVSGSLSGKISISGIHRHPTAQGHLSVDDLRFGSDIVGPVALSVEASEQRCVGTLDAGSPSTPNAGRAMLRATAGCAWKNATVPFIDRHAGAEIALDTTQFPLAAVQPLVTAVFGRLRGDLDAHLRASGRPDEGVGRWVVRGEAHVHDTSLLPLLLGREINRLDVEATADGTGMVRIAQFSGEMGAGAFTGQGTLLLRENTVDRAHAELHVARRRAIPVTMEGVSYGTVWGDVVGDAHLANGQLMVALQAPTLRLELPPQRTGNLERLDYNPAVVVLQPLSATPPTTAVGGGPGSEHSHAPRIVLDVQLGDNVGVSRDDLKIELTTPPVPQNPKIALDGEITIDGSIRILGGRVPVAGRVFRVERGVVQFGGSDPDDPALDVDAVYEGPDTSITIKVHVGGTAKDLKLTLQSTPAKSQSEILAILTFGEAAPATSGPSGLSGPAQTGPSTVAGAAGSAAAGVGSAIVTTGLNQILSQSVIPIRTSISASTTSTASASASVDFSERVRIEYIRSFGTPTQVGQQQDDNQFAFDWRFKPRWILRTIVGTRGTAALDLLWQRWY